MDYNIEALFLYQFTKYVDWPSKRKEGDFVIGIFGESPIIKPLATATANKKVGNQSIKITKSTELDNLSQCHIVFVPESQSFNLPSILNEVSNKSVLIVTEKKGMIKKGAAINFVIQDDKMRFELSKKNITGRGMNVAGELLRLAILVD